MRIPILISFLFTAMAATASALDHPLATGVIRLEDPAGHAFQRRFRFRIGKQVQINTATLPDPTFSGATLEVFGTGAGDGNTGVLTLPAATWRRLRSGGYHYRDHSAINGVSQVLIVPRGSLGGALHISGRTANWPYQVTQPQGTIKVKLTIGTDVYCAAISELQPNRAGIAFGKKAAAPVDCN